MIEEHIKDKVFVKQNNEHLKLVRDVFIGTFLFIGINLTLLLANDILNGFFWKINSIFFGSSTYYLKIFDGVMLAGLLFINIAIFIYLIVKRPRMVIGVIIGIPVLILTLFFLWLIVCLFIVILWFAAIFLRGLGLV